MTSGANKMRVEWSTSSETFRREIDADSALGLLDELHRQTLDCKPMVLFWRDDGLEFGIAVACNESVLTFQETVDPPYFISKGNGRHSAGLELCLGETVSEYPPSSTISWDVARRAAVEFFALFQRPTCVDWETL
jgi:hypothetical protein